MTDRVVSRRRSTETPQRVVSTRRRRSTGSDRWKEAVKDLPEPEYCENEWCDLPKFLCRRCTPREGRFS